MPNFSYTAKSVTDDKPENGVVQADTTGQAIQKIKAIGLVPIALKETKHKSMSLSVILKRIPLKEKIIFTRQLAVMNKAGLPLVKAVDSLRRQTTNDYFKTVLSQIATDIKGGSLMSKAIERFPKVFPEMYVSVIKSGEQTGQLSTVLFELADQQEKDADLISKVRGAMIYPAVILSALVGVVVLILVFVLPSLQTVFADAGATLPLATRFLLGASSFTTNYWYIILIIIAGSYVGLHFFFKTRRGMLIYDKLKIRIPVFGTLTKKVYIARFARTMSMLTKASIPILQAVKIVKQTINNIYYQEAFERISRKVEGGKTIAQAIEVENLFPPMVTQLISLGEESGTFDASLTEIANFYDKEVDSMSKNLATLLEPMLIILMGLGVAFVVAAVLGPIYGMVQKI